MVAFMNARLDLPASERDMTALWITMTAWRFLNSLTYLVVSADGRPVRDQRRHCRNDSAFSTLELALWLSRYTATQYWSHTATVAELAANTLTIVRVQLKCDGTRWRTGGEVKGKLANGVGSQYSSHYLGTWLSSITKADEYTLAASSRLNWRPRRFKWTLPVRRKTKSGFCACAFTFQTQSTTLRLGHFTYQQL
jgi:hypothetical protein